MVELYPKLIVTPGKLLSGESLLQIHVNGDKVLPKVGLKDFAPSNSWLEKKQIESLLDEHKSFLEEERVEKWSSLASVSWNPVTKLAEVTRRCGKYFQTMGFEKNGTLCLYPEEALYLLETNSLELYFGGLPLSLQQAYGLLLGSDTGCTVHEYRTYSHLLRQGYRVLRTSSCIPVTRYERQIRLDQHSQQKRFHPAELPAAGHNENKLHTTAINHRMLEDNCLKREKPITSISDSGEENNLCGYHEKSQESILSKGFSNDHYEHDVMDKQAEATGQAEEEKCCQVVDDRSETLQGDLGYFGKTSSTRKALGIAQSLVSLGTDLIIEETETSEGYSSSKKSSNANAVLCDQIIQVLGSHFNPNISKEALEAVALSAAETILSHGTQKLSVDETDLKAQELVSSGTEKKVESLVMQQEDENADENKNSTVTSEVFQSRESASSTAMFCEQTDDVIGIEQKGEALIETNPVKVESTSISLKRQQISIIGDDVEGEHASVKKAKLLNVADLEIEVLDVISEKQVEVVDIAEDDSDPDLPENEKSNKNDRKTEIIDIDIASQSECDSNSAHSTDNENSSDSSIICVKSEVRPKKNFTLRLSDLKRRRILNRFPCMHNAHEITVFAPEKELIPNNVQPQHSQYTINRWKINNESKPKLQEVHGNMLSSKNTDHSPNMNPWSIPQGPPPNVCYPVGGVPNDPWALLQTLAGLLLPMIGQPPQPQQMWPQVLSTWAAQQRPAWPTSRPWFRHQPNYQSRQQWQSRGRHSHGYRHNNFRFSRSNSFRHPYVGRPRRTNFPRQMVERRNQISPESSEALTSNDRPLGSRVIDSDAQSQIMTVGKGFGECSDFLKLQALNSSVIGGEHVQLNQSRQSSGRGKQTGKRAQPLKGRGRYFNPPKKYHHMRAVMGESQSQNSTIKSESGSLINISDVLIKSNSSESSNSEMEDDNNQEELRKLNECPEEDNSSQQHDQPLLKPNQCSSFGSVSRSLQVIQQADFSLLASMKLSRILKPVFDVFLPNVLFKKGCPPTPNYHLCIMEANDPVPSPCEVSFLSRELTDGAPALFAVVHPDSVSFFQFWDVALPILHFDF